MNEKSKSYNCNLCNGEKMEYVAWETMERVLLDVCSVCKKGLCPECGGFASVISQYETWVCGDHIKCKNAK